MTEEHIKKMNDLVNMRDYMQSVLDDGLMVREIKAKQDWEWNPNGSIYKKRMVAAVAEIREVSESIMRNRANECIREITEILLSYGVDS